MNDDLISRQAAIDAVNVGNLHPGIISSLKSIIEEIPSAEPEIIHCGECAFAEVLDIVDVQDGYVCQFHPGSIWFSGSFCSWAKVKMEVTEWET